MRILIATDGSDFSREAVRKCCEIVDVNKVKAINIISVFESPAFVGTETFSISAENINEINKAAQNEANCAATLAEAVIREYFPPSVDITPSTVMGIPEREIIETADEWEADLIVLGSHGRGFWGRAMIGSVSDAVIHNACCPVLIVSGRQKSAARDK